MQADNFIRVSIVGCLALMAVTMPGIGIAHMDSPQQQCNVTKSCTFHSFPYSLEDLVTIQGRVSFTIALHAPLSRLLVAFLNTVTLFTLVTVFVEALIWLRLADTYLSCFPLF
ncbi:hypothetical protein ECG_09506 [Echinococcus granulosus]|nr:hypothetical protein ECG_09506 [Echinococcus granulosus]